VRVPFLDHPRPIAFAHRGGAAHAPENSWAAFEHAIKLGYAYLETDARATADGRLVAFHDRTLDRITDASGPVNALSYREVAALRVGGTEPIPLIEDLIAAWPDVRFNIDLKDVIGQILQDEKYPGVHIAFGNPYGAHTGAEWDSSTHIDVVGRKFNIWVDDEQIMRDGRFLVGA